MYCKHCYATIPDGDNFCPSCGKAVNAQPAAQPAAPAPTPTPMMPPPPRPARPPQRKTKALGVALILFGLVAIVFGVVALSLDSGSREWNETYGGDAYTGIQNAAAQTATNLVVLVDCIKTVSALGFFLGGLVLIAVGAHFCQKLKG